MIILAFIPEGRSEPTVLYDNHHPKGHHKHIDGQEFPCVYSSVARLRSDFLIDATNWKERKEGLYEGSLFGIKSPEDSTMIRGLEAATKRLPSP